MTIGAVVFDLAGVVCRFDRRRRLTALSAASGLPPALVEERLYGSGLVDAADSGKVSADQLADIIRERLGLTWTVASLEELWTLAFEPDPAVLAVIGRLHGTVRLALLTNNDALVARAFLRLFPDVTAAFDRRFFSGELGARKPDAQAYLLALSSLGSEPQQTLFIDDSEANVAGARSAGLAAIHFAAADGLDPVQRLTRDLRAHGLLTGPLPAREYPAEATIARTSAALKAQEPAPATVGA
jgi:HAD superfamily hydrolase (TIGR01509 family)